MRSGTAPSQPLSSAMNRAQELMPLTAPANSSPSRPSMYAHWSSESASRSAAAAFSSHAEQAAASAGSACLSRSCAPSAPAKLRCSSLCTIRSG